MKINIHNQTQEDIKDVVKLLKKVFRPIKEKLSMEIIFVTQEIIHEMNRNFRQIDRPTDVLSFVNDDESIKSLGDIFISLEQAHLQAKDLGHSFEREVGFLAVHGYLHLKGYDHHSPDEEKEMIEMQEYILNKANLKRS
ncbi:rRNA maturation RNase YbeY [Tenericutes bacterium MZ-XQ]|nr:rRNA maturation RNase YbeY [Tenericutes bacterium MZ-XQ]